MRKKINTFITHPLVSGSAIFFIGSGIANLFNFLFNLGMGRLLSISEYGSLAVLISIVNIFHVLSSSVITVFIRFTAFFEGKKEEGALWILFKKGTIWIGIGGILVAGLVVALGDPISNFLNIDKLILTQIVGIIVFFTLISAVPYGILQGQLRFITYSFFMVFSSLLKFILGLWLVFIGLSTFGAIGAILLASFIEYSLLFSFLHRSLKITSRKDLKIPDLHKKLSMYGLPVLLSSFGMTALTTVDIILVKHFLSPVVAGQYAALSLMGRSIFYLIYPVLSVFFPLIAQKHAKQEKLMGTLMLTITVIGTMLTSICLMYFLFPQFILGIFFPAKAYASLAPHLGPYSIFIALYTFAWLFKSFYLSIGKTRIFIVTLGAAILQSLFITFFHKDISQIIFGMIVVSVLLLISLLLYYPRANAE